MTDEDENNFYDFLFEIFLVPWFCFSRFKETFFFLS